MDPGRETKAEGKTGRKARGQKPQAQGQAAPAKFPFRFCFQILGISRRS